MQLTAFTRVITVTLAMSLGASASFAAQSNQPAIISFDAPGADTSVGQANGTFATAINDLGEITGYYVDSGEVTHGFVRSAAGKFKTFEAPGASTGGFGGGTVPSAINDLGTVTGYYIDASGVDHGFLLNAQGKFTTFDVPGAGGYGSIPMGINLGGEVVGYYSDPSGVGHAFLRRADGTFATFSGPDACHANSIAYCYGSAAFSINIFGESAGVFEDGSANLVVRGLVRNVDGKLTSFNAPGAGTGSSQGTGCLGCAPGLNLWGAVAGTFVDANNVSHGYLRSPQGQFTTFNVPGAGTAAGQGTGCPADCGSGLNDFGVIAGNYIDANYVFRVYARSAEGRFTLIDPPNAQLTSFNGLNDAGTVVGYYLDTSGVFHGYLTTPCNP
jgi:hypothetical protein